MSSALAVLALISLQPLTLAGVQAGQTVQTIQQHLERAGWTGAGAAAIEGRYQGVRAVLSLNCGTSSCRPQAVPEVITLTLYGPTCQSALAAVMHENGRPNDARLKLTGGPDESIWSRTNRSLTAYCVDGVVFARLHKN